jgi:gamma-glutamylcyclotransferase (GGCT)/AIG2-like uncharacterized protein YtfP
MAPKELRETLNPNVNLLFVYGTLLRETSGPLARYLSRQCRTIAHGFFVGKLFELGGYPGAVYGLGMPGTYPVYGAVLELKDPEPEPGALFRELDLYEEIGPQFPQPHEYIRTMIPIYTDTPDRILDCWVYLYNRDTHGLKEIPGGRYLDSLIEQTGVA